MYSILLECNTNRRQARSTTTQHTYISGGADRLNSRYLPQLLDSSPEPTRKKFGSPRVARPVNSYTME